MRRGGNLYIDPCVPVSIHASVKDATEILRMLGLSLWVSIHASVKDATRMFSVLVVPSMRFNPRICKRCDWTYGTEYSIRLGFNPRICKRCDIQVDRYRFTTKCFNPRICKRCDSTNFLGVHGSFVSIHASVKDATSVRLSVPALDRFQSTHL